MDEHEAERDRREREPRKGAERDRREPLADKVTQEKATPEQLLDQRHHHDEPRESKRDGDPIDSRLSLEHVWVESIDPCWKAQKRLRRDPENKHERRQCDGKGDAAEALKFVVAPEPPEHRSADECLQRVNPIFRRTQPEPTAQPPQPRGQSQRGKKCRHGEGVGREVTPVLGGGCRIHLAFAEVGYSFRR